MRHAGFYGSMAGSHHSDVCRLDPGAGEEGLMQAERAGAPSKEKTA